MSAGGQRTLVARNEIDAKKHIDERYENIQSQEQFLEYDESDYEEYDDDGSIKNHKEMRPIQRKRTKSIAHTSKMGSIGSKLQNMQIIQSRM
jgi:hypothetical protein